MIVNLTTRIWLLLFAAASTADAATNLYLFLGHPRDDGPGEIVQREVERVDFSQYDLLMMGGDYTWSSTASRSTVDYLDAVFNLTSPAVFAALGNHDTAAKSYFTDVTGRPNYYAAQTNGIAIIVLDTTNDGQNILGGELQLLQNTVNALSNCTHLIVVHHHFIWLSDYAPLSHLYGDERIGASSATLSGLNFYDEVYPLLLQAAGKGVEVICVAGDRTGSDQNATYGEFYIEHTTADGIHYLAAGFKEELPANLRTAIEFEHDTEAGTLTWNFVQLTDLPRIPDEPLVITELHYNPSAAQGDDTAFIELMNRGSQPYDLSRASFTQGISFTFPSNTVINAGERVLVAAEPLFYTNSGARVFDYAGSEGPEPGEPLWLRDGDYLEIDYVSYGVTAPWPSGPNDLGRSLMLIRPDLDNELSGSWAESDWDGGTPGAMNVPSTTCTNISVAANQIVMDWEGAVAGGLYRLEWTPSLVTPAWLPDIAEANAGGEILSLSVTNSSSAGFYRLQRVFPVITPPSYTNLVISGAVWRYRDTGDDPGANWMAPSFDDASWAAGPAELGYGDGDEATVVGYGPNSSSKYATTHFRHHFTVADPALLGAMRLNVKVDDGAILYLNGTEVARIRMQAGTVSYSDYSAMGGSEYGFEQIDIPAPGFLVGDNVLAVEVHQAAGTSSDISLDVELMAVEVSP